MADGDETQLPPEVSATRALDTPLSSAPAPAQTPLPERYLDLGPLGSGGMGEVRRVWDRSLQRELAMKILRLDLAAAPEARRRFLAEARMTAGLQHPGIIAVHDQGALPDGRPWLTMREVRGRTFAEVIREPPTEGESVALALRRRVTLLASACEAVGAAHAQGVVHRDLKPLNMMIGGHGEVLVLDWGLARRVGEAQPPPGAVGDVDHAAPSYETRAGQILGSPGYIPPERWHGAEDAPSPTSDVYALGVILHELLTGRRPAGSVRADTLAAQSAGRLAPPAELAAICARALDPDPTARQPDARTVAQELRDWLDGARDLERATALLRRADALKPEISACNNDVSRLRAEADALLTALPSWAPEAQKRAAWDLEDAALARHDRALRLEMEWVRALRAALDLAPDLDEAREQLAQHFRRACDEARAQRREAEALRLEDEVRRTDRGRHRAWLDGDAALTLLPEPADAELQVVRIVRDGRRLVRQAVGSPTRGPMRERVFPQGSYCIDIRAPGFEPLRYPVLLERGAHWDGCPPGEASPRPVRLLPAGALREDERYVPEGWFIEGGDPDAADGLPRARLWLDAFVMAQHPVTNRQYLDFLNALVDAGQEEQAARHAPREQGQGEGEPCVYTRDGRGHYGLGADTEGVRWLPDWPVTMVSWHAARAYADWAGARRGHPLRLPLDTEWCKAARGVDGRLFPWGDHGDPSFARMIDSLPDRAGRAEVTEHPLDESPYGIRGLGGNVRDWCANRYARRGPAIVNGRPDATEAGPDEPGHRLIRGGCWASPARLCRSAVRFAALPELRLSVLGFRLARDAWG